MEASELERETAEQLLESIEEAIEGLQAAPTIDIYKLLRLTKAYQRVVAPEASGSPRELEDKLSEVLEKLNKIEKKLKK